MERKLLNHGSTALTAQGSLKSAREMNPKMSLKPQESLDYMSFGMGKQDSLQNSAGIAVAASNTVQGYDHPSSGGQTQKKALRLGTGYSAIEKLWFTNVETPRNLSFGRQASSNSQIPHLDWSQDLGKGCEAPDISIVHNISIMATKSSIKPRLKLSLANKRMLPRTEPNVSGDEAGLSEKFARYLYPCVWHNGPRLKNILLENQPILFQPKGDQEDVYHGSPVLHQSPQTLFRIESFDKGSPMKVTDLERGDSLRFGNLRKPEVESDARPNSGVLNRTSLRFMLRQDQYEGVPSWAAQTQELGQTPTTSVRRFTNHRGQSMSKKSLVSGVIPLEPASAVDSHRMSAISPHGRSGMGISDYMVKMKASAVTVELLVDRVPDFNFGGGGGTTPVSQAEHEQHFQQGTGRHLTITDTLTGQRGDNQNSSWSRFSRPDRPHTNTLLEVQAQSVSRQALDTNPDLEALLAPFITAAVDRIQKAEQDRLHLPNTNSVS